MSKQARIEVIKAIFKLPYIDILPDTPGQRQLLEQHQANWKLVSCWLEYFLGGRLDFFDSLYSNPIALQAKPLADFVIAIRDFCIHVYPRLRPPGIDNFEQLWVMIVYSMSLEALRSTGYYGDIAPKLKGAQLEANSKTAKAYKELLDSGINSRPLVKGFDPKEHLLEITLDDAIKFANRENDSDLETQIKRFQLAQKNYYRQILRSPGPILALPHPDQGLIDPSKGRPPEPPSKPKRGRGRPPKGGGK